MKNDDLSKYAGKYHLVQPKQDSAIKYDFITFYLKNDNLYCSRDFMFTSASIGESKNKNQEANHQDYQVVSIDSKYETITLKYMTNQCVYKFRTNKKGNLELVVMDGVLIYEKR